MSFQFTPDHIRAIIAGNKTMTRRAVKEGEEEEVSLEKGDHVFFKHNHPFAAYPASEQRTITAVYTAASRLKWRVGQDYAVVPGRGKPGVWWKEDGDWIIPDAFNEDRFYGPMIRDDHGCWSQRVEYRPLRIRITAIRREQLGDISEADAVAEGCEGITCPECGGYAVRTGAGMMEDSNNPYGEPIPYPIEIPCGTCAGHGWMETPSMVYHTLWDSINTRKGTRWQDSPPVWTLTFEVER